MRARLAILVVAAGALSIAPNIRAHWEDENHWPAGSVIAMQLQMGPSPAPLVDGNADWDAVTEAALNSWNVPVADVKMIAIGDFGAGLTALEDRKSVV